MGEHSIEIIMKDEQLNVTPNFYTYDSSKIKVGSVLKLKIKTLSQL